MKLKTKRLIKAAIDGFIIISCLLFAWMFISWIDVVTHNLDPEPVYQAWNFFALLF